MENLEISLSGANFGYIISSLANSITAFTATATRRTGTGGLCSGMIMTIDQDGGEVDKRGCERW